MYMDLIVAIIYHIIIIYDRLLLNIRILYSLSFNIVYVFLYLYKIMSPT